MKTETTVIPATTIDTEAMKLAIHGTEAAEHYISIDEAKKAIESITIGTRLEACPFETRTDGFGTHFPITAGYDRIPVSIEDPNFDRWLETARETPMATYSIRSGDQGVHDLLQVQQALVRGRGLAALNASCAGRVRGEIGVQSDLLNSTGKLLHAFACKIPDDPTAVTEWNKLCGIYNKLSDELGDLLRLWSAYDVRATYWSRQVQHCETVLKEHAESQLF